MKRDAAACAWDGRARPWDIENQQLEDAARRIGNRNCRCDIAAREMGIRKRACDNAARRWAMPRGRSEGEEFACDIIAARRDTKIFRTDIAERRCANAATPCVNGNAE